MKKYLTLILTVISIGSTSVTVAATSTGQLISLACGYAIAAVIGEMGTRTSNLVMQEALSKIDVTNGEFVCLQPGDGKIYVRLQSTAMSADDNKLVFTIDTHSYEIERTIYGR